MKIATVNGLFAYSNIYLENIFFVDSYLQINKDFLLNKYLYHFIVNASDVIGNKSLLFFNLNSDEIYNLNSFFEKMDSCEDFTSFNKSTIQKKEIYSFIKSCRINLFNYDF